MEPQILTGGELMAEELADFCTPDEQLDWCRVHSLLKCVVVENARLMAAARQRGDIP